MFLWGTNKVGKTCIFCPPLTCIIEIAVGGGSTRTLPCTLSWKIKLTLSEEMRGQFSKLSIFLIATTFLRTGKFQFSMLVVSICFDLGCPVVGKFGCTNVCCVDCVDEEICARCYQLFGNKIGCPCVQHNKGQNRFL